MKLTADSGKILSGDAEQGRQELARLIDQLAFIINGNLDFANFKAEFIDVTFNATYSDVDVRHKLGRTPNGYLVVRSKPAMTVYDGLANWNQNSLFVASTYAGTARLLVF